MLVSEIPAMSTKKRRNRKYTAKVGQDNVNIGIVTIFRLAKTSLPQVYWMDKCLLKKGGFRPGRDMPMIATGVSL